MDQSPTEPDGLSELRRRAQVALRDQAGLTPEMAPQEAATLVHELRTHQLELEMQNEELRRAQQELLQSRNRYSDLYDFAPAGHLTVSSKGLILEANLTVATLLDVERSRLLGQPLSAFIVDHDQDTYYHHRRQVLDESDRRHGCEFRVRQADGTSVWVLVQSQAIACEQGEAEAFRTSWIDISERKRLQEQLLQAQRLDAIGGLAGGVAHDFNNLLTIILGNAALLREALGQSPASMPDLLEDLTVLEEASRRAATLTRQLLAFSRQQVARLEVIDISRVLTSMEGMLRRLVSEDIELELLCAADSWQIRADPVHIEQIVLNLVANANDALANGGHLVIKTANVIVEKKSLAESADVSPGRYVELTVTDTGSGMNEEVCQRVFEPFFTTKPMGHGTGMGLAAVHGLVKQMGGHISVRSKLGAGTTFKVFFLPRRLLKYHALSQCPPMKYRASRRPSYCVRTRPSCDG